MTQAPAVVDLPQQASEVLIDGRLYDVTGFKHPGGSIIKFMQGGADATEAFREFHTAQQSGKARKRLAALPNRPCPPPPASESAEKKKERLRLQKLSSNFATFRRQLESEGYFKPSLLHMTYRLTEIIIMHIVGFYLLFNTSMWLIGLAIL